MSIKVVTIAINKSLKFNIDNFISNLVREIDFDTDQIFTACVTGDKDFIGYKNESTIVLKDHFKYNSNNPIEALTFLKLSSGSNFLLDSYSDNFGLHRIFSRIKLLIIVTQNPFPYYIDINLPLLHSVTDCIIYIFKDSIKISKPIIDPFKFNTKLTDPLNISWRTKVSTQIPINFEDIANFIPIDKFSNFDYYKLLKYV